ncbi:MAG: glycosyl hydrolase [Saprospiraceae bacterium]|nr:glycosyl hydrolase [Saprospiraceae bacterium]
MKYFLFSFLTLFLFSNDLGSQKQSVSGNPNKPPSKPDLSALSFRSIGPAVTSGRIADIAVNPNNHDEYYVAVASGGVWKTVNHGVTFMPIFDGQGSYSIGCLAIDPSNTNTIWVGTGENNNQRSVAYGDGVYRSDDGGKSWSNMGLKNSEHIGRIVVDPTDGQTVYVAAYGPVWSEGGDRGLYKTTDGGKTWTLIKSVSQFTGCNDIVMDPRNPKVLFAAFHQRMRKVFTYIGGGPESALFKSTDGGVSWNKVGNGFPSGDVGRIGLAVSPANPDIVYAVVEATEDKGGIYKSMDRGASWTKQSGFYTSGNYYQEIDADPKDPNKVFITDTYYKVSYDGGKTVVNLGEINKHIDNHCIWIDPKNTRHLIVGCDGGLYETWDHAASWHFKENLPVTQFYKVSTDNDLPFYHVHGGTQDNLSLGVPSRSTSANGIVNADVYVTSIGDGFETQVDPTDPNIIYAQSQYGGLLRFDRRNGEYLDIKPIEGENEAAVRWNWDAPLLISQFSHTRLYFGANKLFRTDDRGSSWTVISPDLSRQLDRNKLEVMGKVWSVDAIAKNGSTDIYGQMTSIAESKFDENMLWVGTDDGLIQLTTDGGKSWKAFDGITGVPERSYVHQIIASLHDKNTAYVCFNHHRYGDFKPYLLKTTDAGKSWKSIAGNLPVRGSVYTVAEDHVDPNLLFVGTEFGCFYSLDGGMEWTQLKNGLPTIAVRDIEIQRRENDLVLGTFGRGFYILDNYSCLRNLKSQMLEQQAAIFDVKPGLLYHERYPLGLRDKGHLGSQYYSAKNPKPGVYIDYHIKNEVKKLKALRQEMEKTKTEKSEKIYYPSIDSLRAEDYQADPYLLFTFSDQQGQVVRHIKTGVKKGIHRLHWDGKSNTPAPLNARYTPTPDQLFGGSETGYMVKPGNYYVTLSLYENGRLVTLCEPKMFSMNYLQQSSIPQIDLSSNDEFNKRVYNARISQSSSAGRLQLAQSRMDFAHSAIRDGNFKTDELLQRAWKIQLELNKLKVQMNGDASLSKREFETPPSIAGRIGQVQGSAWGSTAPIPEGHKKSLEIAEKQLIEFNQSFQQTEAQLKKLEDELNQLKAPYYQGR